MCRLGEPESWRIRPQALTNNDHGGIAAADDECTISQEQHQFEFGGCPKLK
jgi:hypothetical protein